MDSNKKLHINIIIYINHYVHYYYCFNVIMKLRHLELILHFANYEENWLVLGRLMTTSECLHALL
jgi:hypothetical protein